ERMIGEGEEGKSRIESKAAGEGERIKAEADAEASRTYAEAFGQDARFYQFLRTLRGYDKLLDDKTTIFLPAEADALRMLHFDRQSEQVGHSPPTTEELSTGAGLLQNKKREEQIR